jgi:hypothetical protein
MFALGDKVMEVTGMTAKKSAEPNQIFVIWHTYGKY